MIPVNDLKAAVAKNRHFFHISTDEVHKMIEECDKNGDEMIDFPEFCEIVSFIFVCGNLLLAKLQY